MEVVKNINKFIIRVLMVEAGSHRSAVNCPMVAIYRNTPADGVQRLGDIGAAPAPARPLGATTPAVITPQTSRLHTTAHRTSLAQARHTSADNLGTELYSHTYPLHLLARISDIEITERPVGPANTCVLPRPECSE